MFFEQIYLEEPAGNPSFCVMQQGHGTISNYYQLPDTSCCLFVCKLMVNSLWWSNQQDVVILFLLQQSGSLLTKTGTSWSIIRMEDMLPISLIFAGTPSPSYFGKTWSILPIESKCGRSKRKVVLLFKSCLNNFDWSILLKEPKLSISFDVERSDANFSSLINKMLTQVEPPQRIYITI